MPASRRLTLKNGLQVGDWTLLGGGQLGREVWAVENSDGVAGVIKTARGVAGLDGGRIGASSHQRWVITLLG